MHPPTNRRNGKISLSCLACAHFFFTKIKLRLEAFAVAWLCVYMG